MNPTRFFISSRQGVGIALKGKANLVEAKRWMHDKTTSKYKSILLKYSQDNALATITLNKPKKKNAFSKVMYNELDETLRMLSKSNEVKIILLTGSGDYYSSGNDLSNFSEIMHPLTIAKQSREICYSFVDSFISSKKPIIVAVNGPAYGIAVTTLGLCDAVFASDTATFKTPFAELGQAPEGCSSYMFPLIMGEEMSRRVLGESKSLTAIEALRSGLVHHVYPFNEVKAKAEEYCLDLATNSKKLTRRIEEQNLVELLRKVNKEECDECEKKWVCKESFAAIAIYLQSRNMKTAAAILRVANMLGPLWGQPK